MPVLQLFSPEFKQRPLPRRIRRPGRGPGDWHHISELIAKLLKVAQQPTAVADHRLLAPTYTLDLSARSLNACRLAGLNTVGDLTKISRARLLLLSNVGEKSAAEIEAALARSGLQLDAVP
jgi:DNA-directed RNA polymerase alpha subunit